MWEAEPTMAGASTETGSEMRLRKEQHESKKKRSLKKKKRSVSCAMKERDKIAKCIF